jgi:hypothetical protein
MPTNPTTDENVTLFEQICVDVELDKQSTNLISSRDINGMSLQNI